MKRRLIIINYYHLYIYQIPIESGNMNPKSMIPRGVAKYPYGRQPLKSRHTIHQQQQKDYVPSVSPDYSWIILTLSCEGNKIF